MTDVFISYSRKHRDKIGERFIVIDERMKRDDPAAPWDIGLIKSKGGRVAPAYDDDPDEPFFGHK